MTPRRHTRAIRPAARTLTATLLLIACGVLATAQGEDPSRPQDPARARPAADAAVNPVADVARIPVHVINGRLVVGCQLAARKRIACNLFVDFDAPVGLLLHNKAADGIEAENEDGSANSITIFLPDINLSVYQREVGEEKPYDDFTKWWSKELGENAVVGTIGARVLARYHVTFDLPAGFLELSAPHARAPEPPPAEPGSTLVPITVVNDLAWFKVGYGDHHSAAMAIATSRFDSWIDRDLCTDLGHPAGDIGPVRLGALDLAPFVAFRPEEVRHVHPDGVFGLTGLNLLSYFRVEVDRVNLYARITQSRPAQFPAADLEYFRARVDGTPEGLEHWLDAHPTERLAGEASNRLLDQLVRIGADGERVKNAMTRIAKTTPEDLQATGALGLVQAMLAAGKPDYALTAGALGIDGGRKDRYPDAVHKLHARMGDVLLEKGDRREAWKHLLSAAFGLPEDGPLNLSLARYYEAEGRYTRAFSRYLVALLSPDSGTEAIDGLQRVHDKVPDAESFSVDAVERLIAGKVQGFGVASRFEPIEGRTYTRTVLSELYTCAHAKGEIGVTLARDGLRDFFPPDRLVLVTYHVPSPDMEPLVNRLSLHQWEEFAESEEAAHRFDDVEPAPPAGLVKHKEQIFDITKKITLARLDEESEHVIEITAAADATGIRGSVIVRGPAAEDDWVQILLVERGVLFPGKSKVVIHHNVARAALTKAVEGETYEPKDGSMTIAFDRAWADLQAENEAFLAEREAKGGARMPRFSSRIDPRQARVVVIVRAKDNGRVLQCAQLDPVLPEDMR